MFRRVKAGDCIARSAAMAVFEVCVRGGGGGLELGEENSSRLYPK